MVVDDQDVCGFHGRYQLSQDQGRRKRPGGEMEKLYQAVSNRRLATFTDIFAWN
jgi:hypothetical protein